MNIIITGVNGFIGTNYIKKFLKKKNKYLFIVRSKKQRIYSNRQIKYIENDISNIGDFEKKVSFFKPEAIIHLAWDGIPRFDQEICKKNYHDTMIFFKKIIKIPTLKKIIVTGSCMEKKKIFSKNQENYKYFVRYKKKIFNFLLKKTKLLNFAWLQVFYVYGKNQRPRSLINLLLKNLKKGKKFKLSNPDTANDFVHVDDVNKAIDKLLIAKFKNGIYEIGSGKTNSVNNFAYYVENILFKKNKYYRKIKDENNNIFAANTKKINSVAKVRFKSLKNGLIRTIKKC
tara:strand:- start:13547 stop:14404 length:858 start_codon:yes stop_codon:yes gene_type:complete